MVEKTFLFRIISLSLSRFRITGNLRRTRERKAEVMRRFALAGDVVLCKNLLPAFFIRRFSSVLFITMPILNDLSGLIT